MMDTLLLVLDLGGTFVFALSGAMAGVKHRLDLFGVLVLVVRGGQRRRHHPRPADRRGAAGGDQRLALSGGLAAGRH